MSRWLTIASIDLAAGESARAAHQQHHAGPAVEQRRLRAREGEPVVGGADDQRPLREAELVQRR